MLEPELSVVVFRRMGWTAAEYSAWSDAAARRAALRSSCRRAWHGETVLRYCVVNPRTTVDDIAAIIESLK